MDDIREYQWLPPQGGISLLRSWVGPLNQKGPEENVELLRGEIDGR